jgi:hypothetical protein
MNADCSAYHVLSVCPPALGAHPAEPWRVPPHRASFASSHANTFGEPL